MKENGNKRKEGRQKERKEGETKERKSKGREMKDIYRDAWLGLPLGWDMTTGYPIPWRYWDAFVSRDLELAANVVQS